MLHQGLFHPVRSHLGHARPPADSGVWMIPLLGQPFLPRPDCIGALFLPNLGPKVNEEAKRAKEQESV